jgi:hypothetical protein
MSDSQINLSVLHGFLLYLSLASVFMWLYNKEVRELIGAIGWLIIVFLINVSPEIIRHYVLYFD